MLTRSVEITGGHCIDHLIENYENDNDDDDDDQSMKMRMLTTGGKVIAVAVPGAK